MNAGFSIALWMLKHLFVERSLWRVLFCACGLEILFSVKTLVKISCNWIPITIQLRSTRF